MPAIIYRLAEALLPDYEVERELASGGMGIVFLARDVRLDRQVAIKIVRPELATAAATQRFLREARVLAQVRHSHVLSIHRAGEAGGFYYYVMDYVEGETLAQRLERGPLSRQEALKLGRDVLDALEAVHAGGVVHRDIKPSNIFLVQGRALLADFGISTPSGPQTAPDSPGDRGVTGTPGYMPPEQAFGWEVTPRTDIYSFGMVLYETLTGRRWKGLMPDEQSDWSGVPHSLLPFVKRSLEWKPEDRWPDARTFRRALWRTRTTKYRRRTLLLTLSGLAVGAALVFAFARRAGEAPEEWYDLAVLPFAVSGDADTTLGLDLASITALSMPSFLRVTPAYDVMAWRDSTPADAPMEEAPQSLRAEHVAFGRVARSGDSVVIDLEVIDHSGHRRFVSSAHRAVDDGYAGTGAELALALTRDIAEDRITEYRPPRALSDSVVREFVEGERAFYGNAWLSAVGHFGAAVELDPGFPLAYWRLAEAWRWLLTGEPTEVDLAALLADHRDELGDLDRRLIAAQITPDLEARLRAYEEAATEFPNNGYATFLWGEEWMHRGALIGRSLDSAAMLLELATTKSPNSAPAWEHLLWVSFRLGHKDAARRALDHFTEVSAPPEEVDVYTPPLYEFLYTAMFEPDLAEGALSPELLADPGLAAYLRMGAAFGAHRLLAELGGLLLSSPSTDRAARATATQARGLGLFALGRPVEALRHFDVAADLYGTLETAVQAAEWRIVPAALGFPGIPEAEVERGRMMLERFAADPGFRARAAWALGMDALVRGDRETAEGWRDILRGMSADTCAERLEQQLQAIAEAATDRWSLAIETSRPLLALDSAGLRMGDPFARAVLHIKRAEWHERVGRPARADSARRWYEHMIMRTQLLQEAEPAEIDWALGVWTEFLRGVAALEHGDPEAACRHMARVALIWTDPEPALEPMAREAAERAAECRQ
jgi:tetratricopeptide (TPR) repeat protein/TolB-like protein